jgi:hypothetical protein
MSGGPKQPRTGHKVRQVVYLALGIYVPRQALDARNTETTLKGSKQDELALRNMAQMIGALATFESESNQIGTKQSRNSFEKPSADANWQLRGTRKSYEIADLTHRATA